MNKLIKIIILLIITILIFIFRFDILNYVNFISELDKNLLILSIIFCFFFIPFISTFLILLTSMIFYQYGFYISYLFLIISSGITFLIFKNLKKKFSFKINSYSYLDTIFKKGNSIYSSDYAIFLSRLLIPPFAHNLSYALIDNVRLKNFLIMISISELPIVFTLNMIGKTLQSFDHVKNTSLKIFLVPSFYLPTIFLFLLVFVVKMLIKQTNK